jgi:sulfate adenylyltransferase
LNVHRLAFVASEVAKCGGAVICSPIAPYDEAREAARKTETRAGGRFYLVHVDTPLDYCIAQDRTGTYEKAKKGEIRGFTGIDDPYEAPKNVHLRVDTSQNSISQVRFEWVDFMFSLADFSFFLHQLDRPRDHPAAGG